MGRTKSLKKRERDPTLGEERASRVGLGRQDGAATIPLKSKGTAGRAPNRAIVARTSV